MFEAPNSSDCERLQRNDAALVEVYLWFWNDSQALEFSRAVAGNTYLQSLTVDLGPNLTVEGVRLIAQGVRQANITSLKCHPPKVADGMVPEVRQAFCGIVAENVMKWNKLELRYQLDDDDVCCLQQAFNNRATSLSCFTFCLSPALSRRGARMLSNIVANCQNIQLNYFHNIPSNVMQAVFRHGISASTAVQSLTFYGSVGDALQRGLAVVLPTLQKFVLDNVMNLDDVFIGHINAALSRATRLRTLEFAFCSLNDHDFILLCEGLHANRAIKFLRVAGNSITDVGVGAFVENWDQNSTIECLDLSCNKFSVDGARLLLSATSDRPSVLHLKLNHNTAIGCDGLIYLAEQVLPNVQLQTLDLSYCGCEGSEEMAGFCEKKRSAEKLVSRAIVMAVRRNDHLHYFRWAKSDCKTKAKEEIDCFLCINRGRYLLSETYSLALWPHVFANHEKSNTFFFLREQPALIPALPVIEPDRKQRGKRIRMS
jgi:hypothetical protein